MPPGTMGVTASIIGEPEKAHFFVAKLGHQSFASISLVPSKAATDAKATNDHAYSFAKYSLSGDELRVTLMSLEAVELAIKQGRVKGETWNSGGIIYRG